MHPRKSGTPMAPPSTNLRQQSQKRPLDSSPSTPSKRHQTLPFPSAGSLRTPASTEISFTSTPLSTPRTRTELDRYYEDVERDSRRILVVKNQLDYLRRGTDTDPRSSPGAISGSTQMTTKKAITLLEKILKEDQLAKNLEEDRREIAPKKRGPNRLDKNGTAKSWLNKEQTRRAELSKQIRNTRKRISNAWAKLRDARFVTESDILPTATTGIFENDMSSLSSPFDPVAVQVLIEGDSGRVAYYSDSEPMLPTGRTIARARSVISPSVPPEPLQQTENHNIEGDKDATESPVQNGNADTNSNKENLPTQKKAARGYESRSKTARVPRRSIYTPDSGDDEEHPQSRRHERASTHTTTEVTTSRIGVPDDQPGREKRANPPKLHVEETQGETPMRHSEDDIIDDEDEDNSSNDEEIPDVKLKMEAGNDESSDDDDESEYSDAKVKIETSDDDDDSEDKEDDDEGSNVEVDVKVEDEEASGESSEGTREVEDNQDAKDTGDGQDMVQQKEGDHQSQAVVQSGQPSGQPEGPESSRPTTGLFERMNGIQTSGSFEVMMAELRRAAAERERQAALQGQTLESDSSDSSDDESMPDFSPEPDAKPYI